MTASREAPVTLRSSRWFAPKDLFGFLHRTALRSEGLSDVAIAGRPVIGIANSHSELVNCNLHFDKLVAAVKRGVQAAGGLALEFPTISLSEMLTKPTTMLYRNLMSMDIEEMIRSSPLDAVVLVGGCDKTVPAQLMGAASAGVPAIALTGGPMHPGNFRGRRIGAGTDIWRYTDDLRAGRMSAGEYAELEAATRPGVGHCSEMGTASTMATLTEALGMSLPGSAAVPATDARRGALAEETGRRAVEIANEELRPADILTLEALENAVTTLAAVAGSTNAVLHLIALAGRLGVDLPLDRFDRIAARTPVLTNIQPAGEHLFEDLQRAGGVTALLGELAPLLHLDTLTVTGRTMGDNIAGTEVWDRDVLRPLDAPLQPAGGLAVLRGSLAPDGAVIKVSAATEGLLRHRGPALVFEGVDDLLGRIDDPDLPVVADTVLVLRGAGPKGAPGMPEWGMLPIPRKLLAQGVTDMVRISDARMSGTGYGTVVLHAAPESAVGGPLGAVNDGDEILLDVSARRLDLCVASHEISRRLARRPLPDPAYRRGYGSIYLDHVLQADAGADFDVLRHRPGEEETEPRGLLEGWISGW
ncbi:MAG: dihydroxy-acid dehydratase [Acidimicrobiia bacterium]|nr:dihydroxy-acid dehydratase [Acidimicrobiia bacterium]MYJ14151.1 dihydroxy-acid dehydratase [Acidimicrobiia bacterium]